MEASARRPWTPLPVATGGQGGGGGATRLLSQPTVHFHNVGTPLEFCVGQIHICMLYVARQTQTETDRATNMMPVAVKAFGLFVEVEKKPDKRVEKTSRNIIHHYCFMFQFSCFFVFFGGGLK